jgi:hypothetical protein
LTELVPSALVTEDVPPQEAKSNDAAASNNLEVFICIYFPFLSE